MAAALGWKGKLVVRAVFVLGAVLAIGIFLPVSVEPLLAEGGACEDARLRRAYLAERIRAGDVLPAAIGTEDDLFKGEYAFVSYAMAGYALTQIALDAPDTREETVALLEEIIDRLLEPELAAFDTLSWGVSALDSLHEPRGHIGYLGHLNLLLGAYRLLGGERFGSLHEDVSRAIARRMAAMPHHHVETYPLEIYTCDNIVAVASLAVADEVFGGGYQGAIDSYLFYTKKHLLDPHTGLIVFGIDYSSGQPLQRGRGSAAGWHSYFLPMLDRAFAAAQFDLLKTHLAGRLGPFAGVREWTADDPAAGFGDIDSGPVLVWGVSASGFSIAGARWHGDEALLGGLLSLAELFGISRDSGGARHYVASPMLGDAILLAMQTARPWFEGMGVPEEPR